MSITTSNSILLQSVTGLFTVPQQIQGFSVDDLFDMASISPVESMMGADGKLSFGYIPVAKVLNLTLLADSPSNIFFDAWATAQEAAREVYTANGIIRLPGLSKSYVLTKGGLTGYDPMSDAKKMMQPRKYSITFESVVGAPL